ncbi:MAG: Spermidine synthase [Actinobacteria bacterium ADurb.BinA094]|nr:MAG: Spermidine synthase [Actinobacteria bacterium ADurb.BinA094]
MAFSEEIERVRGVSGELALRRGTAGFEIVANGVFLVSAANAASSRALMATALPHVAGDSLDVLIGGLGIGDALDEALGCPRVVSITVAELEPAVIAWFRRYGGVVARRAADAERAGRARLLATDVADLIGGARGMWDVVALDTDNGPEWLVRGENAWLYSSTGLCAARAALRPGGVAVFWSSEECAGFEGDLWDVFDEVHRVTATDMVDGRSLSSVIYIAVKTGDA